MNTENMSRTLNFKNDPLLSNSNIILNKNIVNLYSALVKKTDFHQLKGSHSICTVPYLCGKNLTKEVKRCLIQLDQKYKVRNLLSLRKAFRYYCGEVSYQRIYTTKKLLKRMFDRNMFPFTFLRILANILSKEDKKIEEKFISKFILSTDSIVSFYKSQPVTLPTTLDGISSKRFLPKEKVERLLRDWNDIYAT